MQSLGFDVGGMTCGGSTAGVQHALVKMDDFGQVEVTLNPGLTKVVADLNRVTSAEIESAITQMGFTAKVRSTLASALAK